MGRTALQLLVVVVNGVSSGSSGETAGTGGGSSSCACYRVGSWTRGLACSSMCWLSSDCVGGPNEGRFTGLFLAPSETCNDKFCGIGCVVCPSLLRRSFTVKEHSKIFPFWVWCVKVCCFAWMDCLLKNPYSRFGLISSCADQLNSWCSPMLRYLFTCIFHNL